MINRGKGWRRDEGAAEEQKEALEEQRRSR
jgi:hypothetical protein